jgi:hypothetical protein
MQLLFITPALDRVNCICQAPITLFTCEERAVIIAKKKKDPNVSDFQPLTNLFAEWNTHCLKNNLKKYFSDSLPLCTLMLNSFCSRFVRKFKTPFNENGEDSFAAGCVP